jgi:hypothetical protein
VCGACDAIEAVCWRCRHCKQIFLPPVFYNNLLFGFAVACPLYLRMSSGEKLFILSCSRIAFRYQSKLRHTNIDSQTLLDARCTAAYILSTALHACFGRAGMVSRTFERLRIPCTM